ncbi:hypothetical protein [Selenomonas noxia]|jgi:hypothetical protein|uniref:Chemotaxis phosphatase CheX-like domain-containing protein n=1 Tax=Selenomonas noxia F0398 TaxID=702437 RepID=A0ABN0DSF8_9FIRM|nr:hypothetical protein [Selenomonas noxia]EHG25941.1 hypothetical protein HMPREF9432_00442 [Selenomonas noxia F0398]
MNALHTAYIDTFLSGLADYARASAEVDDTRAQEPTYITISQRLDADGVPLIVALAASLDAFYALASGYSGVSLEGMDELAVDAVGELFNVINGHFSSRMRAEGHAVSIIDPPRHYHGPAEPDAPAFRCIIKSPAGAMTLIAAGEEFIAAQPH